MDQVLVIGGGIVGSSAAYSLASQGARVALVDRADTGQATAAGAGIVAPATSQSAPEPWYPLAFRAVAFYPELLRQLADDGETRTGYEVVGELLVATDEREVGRLEGVYDLLAERKRAGVHNIGDLTRVSPEEAQRLFPPLAPETPAIHISGAARVNGRRIRDALQRAAVKRGAVIVRGNAHLRRDGDRITGASVDGETLCASAVILAGGAWSRQTADEIGVDIRVAPQRGQILHLELPRTPVGTWPIVSGFHSHYMLTFPEHRIVAGATREDGVGYDARVTAGGEYEALGEALRIAPGLGEATLIETRVGFRPASPDGLASLGAVGGVEGLWVATGLGPTGLTIGPYAGKLAADMVQGRGSPFDLTAYSPDRFEGPHDTR